MINPSIWNKPSNFIKIASGEIPKKASFLNINSREHQDGFSFLCLSGERFDGHDFVEDILKLDTPVIIFESNKKNKLERFFNDSKACWIEVNDSLKYFQELANEHVKFWKENNSGIVVAISGSNGKTTTRYMLSHLFTKIHSEKYIITNKKNNNNHIGVPLTIMDVNPNSKIAIIELGSNSPGEIRTVCEIADPDYSFTTNIGATHLEFFDGVEEVFKEESFPYKYSLQNDGVFFINDEDEYLSSLSDGKLTKRLKYVEVENSHINGSYNFYNLSMAFQIATEIDPTNKDQFLEACKSFKATKNRGEWIKRGDCEIFLDAYNANPSSMRASIEGFLESVNNENYLLILGDMNELGEDTKKYHMDLGKWLDDKNINNVVFIGKYTDYYKLSFKHERFFPTIEEYRKEFESDLINFDKILMKASRSVALEKLI